MVKVKIDMTGWKMWEHGVPDSRLTVIQQTDDYVHPKSNRHYARWLCECNCEQHTKTIVAGNALKSGKIKSCGCLQKEITRDLSIGCIKGNKSDLSGECGILWTSNTNEEVYFDISDANDILKHTWYLGPGGYAYTYIDRKPVSMHNFLGYKSHDHHDRNKLNNQKNNLVPCTHQENQRNHPVRSDNTSGFIGVRWKNNLWVAEITIDGKIIHLGSYTDKKQAIRIRLKAEKKYFGDFAPQRHLFEEYGIVDNLAVNDI